MVLIIDEQFSLKIRKIILVKFAEHEKMDRMSKKEIEEEDTHNKIVL